MDVILDFIYGIVELCGTHSKREFQMKTYGSNEMRTRNLSERTLPSYTIRSHLRMISWTISYM